MVVGNMQIKLAEVWMCGSWDEHENRHMWCANRHGWQAGQTHHNTPLP